MLKPGLGTTSSSSDTDVESASFEAQSHRGDEETPTLRIIVDSSEGDLDSLPVFPPVDAKTALERLETKYGITLNHETNKLVPCAEGKNPYFSFSVSETAAPKTKLPAELVSLIQDLVVVQLLQQKELNLEQVTVPLPSKDLESDWKRATTVLCSRNALEQPGRLLLVVPGLNSVGGLWSVSLCLLSSSSPSSSSSTPGDSTDETSPSRLSLQQASVASCLNLAGLNGFAVVVLNPSRSYHYRQRNVDEPGLEVTVINDAKASHREEHLLAVGDHFLINAKARTWAILGHSAAGKTVIDWMARLSERAATKRKDGPAVFDDAFLLTRLAAIALADSTALRLPSTLATAAVKFLQGDKSGVYASQIHSRIGNWRASDSLPLDAPLSLNNNTGRSDTKEGFKSARCILRSAGTSQHSLTIIKAAEPMISWLCHQVEDFETLSVSPLKDKPETVASLASGGSFSSCLVQ